MDEPVAKYKEICLWVKRRLDSGELRPGDKVESEYRLCEQFKVSRQTVRHAIAVLEEEGIVKRYRGSGTYISEGRQAAPQREKTMQIAVMTTSFLRSSGSWRHSFPAQSTACRFLSRIIRLRRNG